MDKLKIKYIVEYVSSYTTPPYCREIEAFTREEAIAIAKMDKAKKESNYTVEEVWICNQKTEKINNVWQ